MEVFQPPRLPRQGAGIGPFQFRDQQRTAPGRTAPPREFVTAAPFLARGPVNTFDERGRGSWIGRGHDRVRFLYKLTPGRREERNLMPKINLGFITSLALIATAVAVWIALFQGWDSL